MAIRLLDLLPSLGSDSDKETDFAYFLTHVPWVAPQAHLHIVFKPAPDRVLMHAAHRLRLPPVFLDFLKMQNGAILFSGALSIYGVRAPGDRINRSDPFSRPPIDIEHENSNWPPYDSDRLLAIGGYGFDGSSVCINRKSFRMDLFSRGEGSLSDTASFSWNSLDEWIRDENSRLSTLFDSTGLRLVNESETVPRQGSRKLH